MKKFALIALFAVLGLAMLGHGQTLDANLVGSVVDGTGAAVPNATIEITNVATGIRTTTRTNAEGQYRFNNIPVGFYNLSAKADGFAVANLKSLDIQLSKTSTANITMQVGTV